MPIAASALLLWQVYYPTIAKFSLLYSPKKTIWDESGSYLVSCSLFGDFNAGCIDVSDKEVNVLAHTLLFEKCSKTSEADGCIGIRCNGTKSNFIGVRLVSKNCELFDAEKFGVVAFASILGSNSINRLSEASITRAVATDGTTTHMLTNGSVCEEYCNISDSSLIRHVGTRIIGQTNSVRFGITANNDADEGVFLGTYSSPSNVYRMILINNWAKTETFGIVHTQTSMLLNECFFRNNTGAVLFNPVYPVSVAYRAHNCDIDVKDYSISMVELISTKFDQTPFANYDFIGLHPGKCIRENTKIIHSSQLICLSFYII